MTARRTRRGGRLAALALAAAIASGAGCARSDDPIDPGLEGLGLDAVRPGIVVPGSTLVIDGDSFVGEEWGTSRLRLRGVVGGDPVDVTLRAEFVDYDRMTALVTPTFVEDLGGDVELTGEAVLEVTSTQDGRLYTSPPLPVTLQLRRALTPAPTAVQTGGLVFVNDDLEVEGTGFLLGGTEGDTVAIVTGTFTPDGGAPRAVGPVEVAMTPVDPFERDRATFRFVPQIAGIEPGTFAGEVTFENRHAEAEVTASAAFPVGYELIPAAIFRIDPPVASLGQYVFVDGGGFVGGEPGASTLLRLQGTFTLTGTTTGAPVDLLLVPELVDGRTVRYVISEDDALGQAIDLRQDTGTFVGTVTPEVSWQGVDVVGEPAQVTLGIAPVKQVVLVDFRPSYVESLRLFGLRAVDSLVRQRILEVVTAAFPAVNIELRAAPVDDFALYSHVELHGPDPNGMGLFGYDNSPGKDTDNQRLYDRLGGVNAMTQEDGYPGYGGVFLESLMQFSMHPVAGEPIGGADPVFDQIFDPLRPDRGAPVVGADLAGGLPVVDGTSCPGTGRKEQIACAIWVMGSLVGGTLAHEIGHSLGLANPYGEGFHNPGDQPGRLMDGGADRPFTERAALGEQGGAMFCDEEYEYLRMILPSSDPPDPTPRPYCY